MLAEDSTLVATRVWRATLRVWVSTRVVCSSSNNNNPITSMRRTSKLNMLNTRRLGNSTSKGSIMGWPSTEVASSLRDGYAKCGSIT
jgi:hypothetical protein